MNNWHITWNDGSTSVWSVSDWSYSEIINLTNVSDVRVA